MRRPRTVSCPSPGLSVRPSLLLNAAVMDAYFRSPEWTRKVSQTRSLRQGYERSKVGFVGYRKAHVSISTCESYPALPFHERLNMTIPSRSPSWRIDSHFSTRR